MNREVSLKELAVAEGLRDDKAAIRALRAPITSRRERAAGSCVSAADKAPGAVRSVSIEEYLKGEV